MSEKIMTSKDFEQYIGNRSASIKFDKLTKEIESEIIAKATEKANKILSAPSISPDTIKGNCFYMSNDGCDKNDGRSPDTPWKTINRLHLAQRDGTVREGDGVFFKRGSIWDSSFHTRYSGDYTIMFRGGVTYSAYGEGPKPLFRNCIVASNPSDWEETIFPNIWRYRGNVGNRYNDIGNIVCDNGKAYGIKICPSDPCSPWKEGNRTVNSGMVTNGMGEWFHSGNTLCTTPSQAMHNNLEFLHDPVDGILYLYFDKGNPAEYFSEIILSKRGHITRCSDSTNVVIDNIAVKFGGSHGITSDDCKSFTVQNCIIGWIGGSLQGDEPGSTVRYGNAVENWGTSDGQYIRDCIVYQCYDAGLTSQYAGWDPENPIRINNVEYTGNVMAYSNSPLELWNSDGVFNTKMTDNYMFYSGYHFGHQRPCKNGSFGCLGGRSTGQLFKNTVMSNNVFMYTSSFAHYTKCIAYEGQEKGITTSNNTYVLGTSKFYVKGSDVPFAYSNNEGLYQFTKETMEFLSAFGVEKDSQFYYYEGCLFPEEEDGVYCYVMPN